MTKLNKVGSSSDNDITLVFLIKPSGNGNYLYTMN